MISENTPPVDKDHVTQYEIMATMRNASERIEK